MDEQQNVSFYFEQNDLLAQYILEFNTPLRSGIEGLSLIDFLGIEQTLLEKRYKHTQTIRSGSQSVQLAMVENYAQEQLLEGELRIIYSGNKIYVVVLSYVDDTHAKFRVNGKGTKKIGISEREYFPNGIVIGVTDVLYQEYAGGIHSATFYVGTDEIILQDDDITNQEGSYPLSVNGRTIIGTTVVLRGTDDNNTVALSGIEVSMTAPHNYSLYVGDRLSKIIENRGDKKELLFTKNWDIWFRGYDNTTELGTIEIVSY